MRSEESQSYPRWPGERPPRHYGAWETVASNIAEGLVARGWQVTLFATADSITSGRLHCGRGPGI